MTHFGDVAVDPEGLVGDEAKGGYEPLQSSYRGRGPGRNRPLPRKKMNFLFEMACFGGLNK